MSKYYLIHGELHSGDELYHHGVEGMRWGVRRYQNEDGTLTPEGRIRLIRMSEHENSGVTFRLKSDTSVSDIPKKLVSRGRSYASDSGIFQTSLSAIYDAYNESKLWDDWD